MTTAAQLQSITATLETYRTHLAAVSHALGALRLVSEQLMRDLERDQSALATHIDQTAELLITPVSGEIQELPPEPSPPSGSASCKADGIDPAIEACAITESNQPDTASKTIASDEPDGASSAARPKPASEIQSRDGSRAEPTVKCDQQVASGSQADVDTVAMLTLESANVVSLESHRRKRGLGTGRSRTAAVITSFLLTAAAAYGSWQFTHTGVTQHPIELTACSGGMMPAHHDCAPLHI